MGRADGFHGILLVDKPAGTTSADVVRRLKRLLGGAKVGHLGTLDPFATGLLPLCVGEGSKIVPFLNQERKTYEGRIRLGRETDTLDATGATVREAAVPDGVASAAGEVARRFTGTIEQVPPMYSAVKQGGTPLHRLARRGIEVERRPRRVEVFRLALRPAGTDALDFEVECSKGTYVRVLAAAIAEALGTRGHLETLRRTGFGPFRIEEAVAPGSISPDDLPLLSLRDALPGVCEREVAASVERDLRAGRQSVLGSLGLPAESGAIAKIVHGGRLVALVGLREGRWRILRVINQRS